VLLVCSLLSLLTLLEHAIAWFENGLCYSCCLNDRFFETLNCLMPYLFCQRLERGFDFKYFAIFLFAYLGYVCMPIASLVSCIPPAVRHSKNALTNLLLPIIPISYYQS
jgi:hypothetical protein